MASGLYSGIYPPNLNFGNGAAVKSSFQITLLHTGQLTGSNSAPLPRPTEGQLFPRGVYSRQNT